MIVLQSIPESSYAHYMNVRLTVRQDLENWRGKLDTQVKSYREVSLFFPCVSVVFIVVIGDSLL